MENKEKNKGIKNAIGQAAIVGTFVLTAYASIKMSEGDVFSFQPRVKVEMKEPVIENQIEVEPVKPVDISTWTSYDEESSYYKVDVDKMYDDFISYGYEQGIGVEKQKEEIKYYLGDEIYTKEIADTYVVLTDLNGREIEVSSEYGILDDESGLSYNDENGMNVMVSGDNESAYYRHVKDRGWSNKDSYYESFNADGPRMFSISFTRDDSTLSFDLFERNALWINSKSGTAKFRINQEEYAELLSEMVYFKRKDDKREFLNRAESTLNTLINDLSKNSPELASEITNTKFKIKQEIIDEKESGPLEDNKVKELEY